MPPLLGNKPCPMQRPDNQDALVVKINTDEEPELGERFRIRSIPTLMVFRDGREVARTAGARPATDIEALVRPHAHA